MYNSKIKTSFFEPRDAEDTGKKTGFNLMIVHFYNRRILYNTKRYITWKTVLIHQILIGCEAKLEINLQLIKVNIYLLKTKIKNERLCL